MSAFAILAVVVSAFMVFLVWVIQDRATKRAVAARNEERKRARQVQRESAAAQELVQAEKEGRYDTVRAWVGWAAGLNNWRDADAREAERHQLFMTNADVDEVDEVERLIDQRMPPDATADQCRNHLRKLYAGVDLAQKSNLIIGHNEAARATAARVYLLTGGADFDFASGMSGHKWMTHEDPNVTAAYLKGSITAKDEIKSWVIRERDALRRFEKNLHAAHEIARGNNADLAALRETNGIDPTIGETWDAQFTALDEPTAQAAIDRLS